MTKTRITGIDLRKKLRSLGVNTNTIDEGAMLEYINTFWHEMPNDDRLLRMVKNFPKK